MTSASVAFAPLCPPTSPVFLPAASRRTPLLCRRRNGHLLLRPWIRGRRPAIFLHPSHRMTKPGCCCFPPVLQCGVYTCRHKEQKNENTKRKVAQLKEFLHWQSSGGKRSLPPANECLSVACLVHPSVVATSGGAPPVKPWQTALVLLSPFPLLRFCDAPNYFWPRQCLRCTDVGGPAVVVVQVGRATPTTHGVLHPIQPEPEGRKIDPL